MPQGMQITAANLDPALLDLPWDVALEDWPEDLLAALPRGISRHTVRFVNLSGRVIAVKEIGESVAYHEYGLLRDLVRLGAPSVTPTAVITGRRSRDGEELTPALVTEHLQFSLPYRAVFSQIMRPETATRLIDSLAALLVRLHLLGFYWGDVSLSNTLFRRDADSFTGYLVDAETGELHEKLTSGQRNYDVDLARTNIIGELMDLQGGEILDEDVDVIKVGNRIEERYHKLWSELTEEESFQGNERWRVSQRIKRLNELGFDVGELNITTDVDGTRIVIQPKVVDAGHHHRQIMRLTGLDVGERQARRMLNDLHTYRALQGRNNEPLELVAHAWLNDVFEPTVRAVPNELKGKREPAQIFHEVLDHRWYLAQQQQRDVPLPEATKSYIKNVLPSRVDEELYLDPGVQDTLY
ncbi:DUF4032 domain-containing protein [Gleimia hominis]|uniref:DUF4032 domain-containing protein n=1 Tax=Gleimia hominis TaxID=595468 RepID=A0ABU3I9H9_9ACTO|nr:DUF4032 domain-containing protein [Gleimia hominis]MDT3767029.1 DUF4032 domain-containing protein [Gleimia hominis]